MTKRNPIARDLRTPKYRQRRIPHKKPDVKVRPIEEAETRCPRCGSWPWGCCCELPDEVTR